VKRALDPGERVVTRLRPAICARVTARHATPLNLGFLSFAPPRCANPRALWSSFL
jgi:hypothetical protein